MRRSISVGLAAIALAFGAANTASADPLADGYAAYERAEYPVALRIWERLAKKGVRAAQINLGLMYQFGPGVPQNYTEAAKWFRLAAEQGDADGQNMLGLLYHEGHGVPQNYAEGNRGTTTGTQVAGSPNAGGQTGDGNNRACANQAGRRRALT